MRKKYLWSRENYLLNWITMIMIAGSIFFVKFYSNTLASCVERLYVFSYRTEEITFGNQSISSCFSEYMELSQIWYLCMLVGIAVISICLFQDMKKKETQEWLFTLPIANKEMFWHQWLRGILAYTIPFLVYIAGILIVHHRNITWIRGRYLLDINWKYLLMQEQPTNYFKLLGMLWLWATACYCVFFFIQVVCKKNILASMISFGILLTPAYITTVLSKFNVFSDNISELIFQIFLLPIDDNSLIKEGWMFYPEAYVLDSFSYIGSSMYVIRIIHLLIIAIVVMFCLFLSYRYFGQMIQQTQPGIFSIGWVRYAILTGFSLCIGMGIFVNLYFYHNAINKIGFVFGSLIFMVAFTLIVDKLMKRRGY